MNIYKISTFIFLIICVILGYLYIQVKNDAGGVVTLSNGAKFTRDEIVTEYDSLSSFLSVESIEGVFSKKIDSLSGANLSYDEADEKMKKFRQWNDIIITKRLKPRAFAFGLERVNNMLSDILIANQKLPDNNKIVGVRAYLVRTHSDATSTRKKWHLDILLVPVLKSGDDYIEFRNDKRNEKFLLNEPNDMLLNTSIPCPNNCHGD